MRFHKVNNQVVSFDWHEVWERKGSLDSHDLRELDGYEHTTANIREIARQISEALQIMQYDKVLEIGCGAGALAQHLDCEYVGIDYSESLLKKHVQILGNSVLHGYANELVFKDNSFDKVFAFGVFHYFPNKEYVRQAIREMERVAKQAIFIGDLPRRSHRQEHLLFSESEFQGAEITQGYYNKDRFNILDKLSKA